MMSNSNAAENVLNDLQQACDLTESIITQVEQSQFDDLESTDAKRQKLIKSIFSVADKSLIDRDLAQRLLELNKEAEVLMQKEKTKIMAQQSKMKHGQKATLAYSQAGS